MKLADILIINQKSDLSSFLILDLRNNYVELVKGFLRRDKD